MYHENFYCLVLTLYFGYIASQLTVERTLSQCPPPTFCSSTDYFTNEDKTESYCSSRNATCFTHCDRCKCLDYHVFVSYQHGCKSLYDVDTILNTSTCLESTDFYTDIPTAKDSTWSHGQCTQLSKKPTNNIDVKGCKIASVYEFDPLNGNKNKLVAHLLDIHLVNFLQCLGCKNVSCPLTNWAGMLIKLELDCEELNFPYNSTSSCFLFKVEGARIIQESILPRSTSTLQPSAKVTSITNSVTKQNSTMLILKHKSIEPDDNTIIIIVVMVGLFLVVIIVLTIMFLRYHKKRLRRKKSHCAHYIATVSTGKVNIRETENPAYQDTNVTYESGVGLNLDQKSIYASPGKKELLEKDTKAEENEYYETAEVQSKDKKFTNSLYGMESTNQEQNMYAETFDNLKLKENEALPEYAYTSNVFNESL